MTRLFIIGAGPGAADSLTIKAGEIIAGCDELFAFKRIGGQLSAPDRRLTIASCREVLEKVASSSSRTIGLLVSGDTGFFSIAKKVKDSLPAGIEVEFIPGISSLQYFCSKLKLSHEGLPVVSVHGRAMNVLGPVSYNQKLFVLTGGENNAAAVCSYLKKNGLGRLKASAGELLSMPGERIVTGTAEELAALTFNDCAVLLLENDSFADRHGPVRDSDLLRDKTPMTKEEVRWISVNSLRIAPSDLVLDIGAGSGSVSLEMGRKAWQGTVYAIEKKEEAFRLLCENRKKLGGFNVLPVFGEAKKALKELPAADKAFIGGSGGDLREIVLQLAGANPNVKIVINAVTLETLTGALAVFKELDFRTSVTQLNSARAVRLGAHDLLTANNPVSIIYGEK